MHKLKLIKGKAWYLGGAPTSIYHFFRLSVPLSVRLSVRPSVRRAPYLRNHAPSDHNFWYTDVKWWYLQVFSFTFLKFWFFGALGEERGKKWPKMKNNYIRYVPYLRNSIAYDHDFWYTCVKWWYLQGYFSVFQNYDFLGC